MEKSFWGPPTWCMIHCSAASYSPLNRYSFKQFIYSLPYLLPCEYCRKHLFKNLETLPLSDEYLADNRSAFMWSYFLHDLVNKQLKKHESPAYPAVERHYFSNIDNPKFWGPCFWRAIHSFAAAYRPDDKVKFAFKCFIISLTGVLPGKETKENYNHYLIQLPLTEEYLKNANNLFLWTYLLHDLVNKKLGKISPSFEEIKSQYFNEHVCSNCGV